MFKYIRLRNVLPIAVATGIALPAAAFTQQAAPPAIEAASPVFTVDAQLALHSVMSLSDTHLQELEHLLAITAASAAARSARWDRIRAHLAGVSRVTVPAVLWFALPNGDYWTLQEGRATNLRDRPYFTRALAGHNVIGDLVVSRSTTHNSAIVAVPVRGSDNHVVGVLGASVYLDSLSSLLREQLGGLPSDLIFFAINEKPLGALNSDPNLIFTDPMQLGDEGMRRAFTEMLKHEQGSVTYHFRGAERTVLYRKSAITGWWYGFGKLDKEPISSSAR